MAARQVVNDRYELGPLPLARGGMGEVWTGRDVKLEREVAVKFVRFPDDETDPELVRRFARESRITARLCHPGVPAVYDVGTHQGRPFMVMQRVHGISVADLVAEQGPLPIGWAAGIAAQVCAVLTAAHRASLVHRDLKPANLMLEPDGTVKVLDFGLAVALEHADLSRITRTGQSIGTPAYMAPEQVLAGLSGPQTDLYALGCVLYEMLTGRQPFTGTTAYAVMNKQVDVPPAPPRQDRTELPAELDTLVLALLRKKPEDRPADAETVHRRLLPHATGLGPLPGVLHPAGLADPVRMYAGVVSRVLAEPAVTPAAPGPPAPRPPKPPVPEVPEVPERGSRRPPEPEPSLHRSQLDRARDEAGDLVRQSRYGQAADVLAGVLEPAARAFGDVDREVLALRRELAGVLFEGGDFRRAGPLYEQLAAQTADDPAADRELVYECRLREATCHALTGQTSLALRQLTALLDDQRRAYGPTEERVLELRHQIGLLQLGAGQRSNAEATLDDLLTDLTHLGGGEHPTATRVRDLLTGLRAAHGPG